MKSWLAKFRISIALDADKPLPESLRQKIAANPELKRFARRTQSLGAVLRGVPPSDACTARFHHARHQVRGGARQPRRAPASSWLAASAAVAALTAMCLWLASHRQTPPGPRSLDGPAMVLEMSENLPGAMPSIVMAPLSNEWARVDRDVQATTQVLLASLP